MKITDIKGCATLNNKVSMPYFGLGVFRMNDGGEVIDAVGHALQAGYIHIDTASLYDNEQGVGIAIAQSGIPRSELFVTSKVWNSEQGYDNTLKAFDTSLERLGFDYLDLYLVHWPVKGKFRQTWRALENLYMEGRVKAIGISNFLEHHIDDLMQSAKVRPMVNQIEFHPYLVQQNLLDYCKRLDIQPEAWSPLMQGKIDRVDLLKKLALKYNKDCAQITLRWNLQKGVITIPKSSRPGRILSNSRIFDFNLPEDEINAIDSLDRGERLGAHPDHFDF